MSTGCECVFREIEPGKWYYILEHDNAPKNAFDWREHADAFGPFDTCEAAMDHLDDNHANPGGFSRYPYNPEYKLDEVMQKLIEKATNRRRRPPWQRLYR